MQNTLRYKCGIICLQMDTLHTHIQKMFQWVTSRFKRLQSLLKSMNQHNMPIKLGVKGHFEKHPTNSPVRQQPARRLLILYLTLHGFKCVQAVKSGGS